HLGLGLAYHDNGHYLSAIDELQTALRLGGPEPQIRETLAACDMKVDRPHEALRELQRLLALSPGNVFAQLRISEAQDSLDQRTQARAVLDAIPHDTAGYPLAADPKQ